jgi:hypothetical protein
VCFATNVELTERNINEAICRRDPERSGYQFVKAVHFQNTQISRGFGGNPAAFEIVTHDHGKLER